MDILILDPDLPCAELMQEFFTLEGLYAENVQTVGAALEAFSRRQFQVVLVDVAPDSQVAAHVARQLRVSAPDVTLVALSAGEIWEKKSFDHYLAKPVDLEVLRRLITS